jgi:hypothetical protein
LVKAGPTIFSLRNWMDDAYARFTVPECFAPLGDEVFDVLVELEELGELLQPAAASPMQVMTISAAMTGPRFLPGIATIVRP